MKPIKIPDLILAILRLGKRFINITLFLGLQAILNPGKMERGVKYIRLYIITEWPESTVFTELMHNLGLTKFNIWLY